MGSLVGRGNQCIQLVKVLYCKLPTIDKKQPTLPHNVQGLNRQPQRWEASVLALRHHGPSLYTIKASDKPCGNPFHRELITETTEMTVA